ncbi:MAG: hypothetical protein KME26_27690 [Oscillatoria princeps RMCB-10]|jgi:hypothetical protein|nr:hypothetical protein [Oscillatoria princeps RMCB-10]
MQAQATAPQLSIEQLVDRIFACHRISRADQQRFMKAMLSKDSFSPGDRRLIARVFDGLQKGLLRVVE